MIKVQVNTDKHIEGSDRLERYINERMTTALGRFEERLTRLEVHLSDQNGEKGGKDDMQCRIEARPKGLNPVIVTARDATMDLAINEAIDRMKATLTSTFGKLSEKN